MLNAYRDLFAVPGTRLLVTAGLAARAPRAMVGLGIVGMVCQRTGNYALAGALCCCYSLSVAAAGPLVARAVDRHGQRRAARATTAAGACALVALLLCSALGAPLWTQFPWAVLAGVLPNVGGMMRARWQARYREGPRLHTAFSMESVADEVSFVIGPILALSLATQVFPEAGVAVALLCTVAGTWIVTARRGGEPAARPAEREHRGSLLVRHPGLSVLVLVFCAFGAVFGAIEVITVAFATAHGHRAAASFALAGFGVTSGAAGLVMGACRGRFLTPRHLVVGLGVLALSLIPLLVVGSLPVLVAELLLTGLFISPNVIIANALVERIVPQARLNEGLTWLLSGTSLGVSLGSLVGGFAVDRVGTPMAYGVPVTFGLCSTVIAAAGCRTMSRAVRPPSAIRAGTGTDARGVRDAEKDAPSPAAR
ncbi:MFS transporter [Kitasatospora sp. NPDC089509]|uniref:MFS transporter n=1 Tax=Kitasatospora sp. NPDC089509 TaxID=3364079 RepID=UPI00381A4964